MKLVSLSDGQSTVVGWSDGNSAHSAMVFAHGEIIVCNRFTVAKPLHHTECIDNALLRRERNEASQRSPKGSEVRLLARVTAIDAAKVFCDKRKNIDLLKALFRDRF